MIFQFRENAKVFGKWVFFAFPWKEFQKNVADQWTDEKDHIELKSQSLPKRNDYQMDFPAAVTIKIPKKYIQVVVENLNEWQPFPEKIPPTARYNIELYMVERRDPSAENGTSITYLVWNGEHWIDNAHENLDDEVIAFRWRPSPYEP